jgi:hypothetical protein
MKKSRHASWTMEQALAFARRNNNTELLAQLTSPANNPRPSPTLPQACVSAPKGGNTPEKPPTGKKPREMNKTEREFYLILRMRFPQSNINYEPIMFRLAHGCNYRPDFHVEHPCGAQEFYETKAEFLFKGAHKSSTTATLTKPKVAAELYRFRFHIAQKIDGQWHETSLPGKIDT